MLFLIVMLFVIAMLFLITMLDVLLSTFIIMVVSIMDNMHVDLRLVHDAKTARGHGLSRLVSYKTYNNNVTTALNFKAISFASHE